MGGQVKGSGHGASCSDADHPLAKPQEAWRSVFWRGVGVEGRGLWDMKCTSVPLSQ